MSPKEGLPSGSQLVEYRPNRFYDIEAGEGSLTEDDVTPLQIKSAHSLNTQINTFGAALKGGIIPTEESQGFHNQIGKVSTKLITKGVDLQKSQLEAGLQKVINAPVDRTEIKEETVESQEGLLSKISKITRRLTTREIHRVPRRQISKVDITMPSPIISKAAAFSAGPDSEASAKAGQGGVFVSAETGHSPDDIPGSAAGAVAQQMSGSWGEISASQSDEY